MYQGIAVVILVALAVASSGVNAESPAEARVPPPQRDIAFVDVTVIPMDARGVLPGQTVVVRQGRIAAMGPAGELAVGDDVEILDGRGRYLLPGLAEMHAHIPPRLDERQWTADVLYLYVANGITFARGMLGAPHHLRLRELAARGEIVSPRIYTSGPSLNGNSVASPEAGRVMVAQQAQAGYDFLKIHPGLDIERYDAIAAAAREHGISWAGHVPHEVGLHHALASGQATVDHLDAWLPALLRDDSPKAGTAPAFFGWNLVDEVDESKIGPLVQAVKAAGAWQVPTESLIQHVLLPSPSAGELARREEMRFVPRQMLKQWINAKNNALENPAYDPALAERFVVLRGRLIKALHEEGAGLLLGADAPQVFNVPGFAIHHELRMLVGAGLTPWEALATGTVNVARFLGEESEFGTVAPGRRADLMLLEADPLEHIGNLRQLAGVMVDGRWLPRAELDVGLEAIAERAQAGTPQAAIRDREADFFAAVAAGDLESIVAHFADDAELHVANMPPVQGREAIRGFYSRMLGFLASSRAEPRSVEVAGGGDMGLSIGGTTNTFVRDGASQAYEGKYSLIWRKHDGHWLIALYSISSNERTP